MGKRKRNAGENVSPTPLPTKRSHVTGNLAPQGPACVQIITGSYDKVLHGITATLSAEDRLTGESSSNIRFDDNFLFNAHSSAVRCLAISPLPPPQESAKAQRLILASGGTDQRINLYHISTHAAPKSMSTLSLPPLLNASRQENSKNKELGALSHHSASINALYFPSHSKLLSGAEDNTIAVTRTRDWAVLSTIKAPIPKSVGRPSGDTAPPSNAPSGISDFAIHPSMKLMISVGRGEKCMRLWNLVTGKKAGVLSFERELLQSVGEGKLSSGEGLKVRWNPAGDEFAVLFNRGGIIFGMDSKPKCRFLPSPYTKLHQAHYLSLSHSESAQPNLLAVATEDGQILFYSTAVAESVELQDGATSFKPPLCHLVARLGGKSGGMTGRVKDFEILSLQGDEVEYPSKIVIAAGSDGSIRLWKIEVKDLARRLSSDRSSETVENDKDSPANGGTDTAAVSQIGKFLGRHETNNRITCLKAFVLRPDAPFEASTDGSGEHAEVDGGNPKVIEHSVRLKESVNGIDHEKNVEKGSEEAGSDFEGFESESDGD